MTLPEFRTALEQTPAGGRLPVPAGEFEGPFVVRRPMTIVGLGLKSVLWARRGPVVTIRTPGVVLEELVVDVTEERDGVSLLVEDAVPPSLVNVRLVGRSRGWSAHGEWFVPPVVDFGRLAPTGPMTRYVTVQSPWPITVKAELDGLSVCGDGSHDGPSRLSLELDPAGYAAGSYIEGLVVVEGGGAQSLIRVTGVLAPLGSVPQPTGNVTPDAPPAAALLDRLFASATPAPLTRARPRAGPPSAPTPPPAASPIPTPPAPTRPMPRGTAPKGSAVSSSRAASPVLAPSASVEAVDETLAAAKAVAASGNEDRAIEIVRHLLGEEPASAEAHAVLASFLEKRGDFGTARAEWSAVLALDPSYPNAVLPLARCNNLLSRFNETVRLLERQLAVEREAGGYQQYAAIAVAYKGLNRLDEALWALDKSLELHPDGKLEAIRRVWQRSLES